MSFSGLYITSSPYDQPAALYTAIFKSPAKACDHYQFKRRRLYYKSKMTSSQIFIALFVILGMCWAESPVKPCLLRCPDYQFVDVQTCTCQEPPKPVTACPLIRCLHHFMLPCQEYEQNEKGCHTCTCKCYRFELMCPRNCKYGSEYATNEKGCKVCRCRAQPHICPPVCANYCPDGRVEDIHGCPTCQCKGKTGGPQFLCPPVHCEIFCKYGHVLNSRGCPTCSCNPAPSS